MRRRSRNALLVILAVVVFLLALGALPSLLKSGDPYYVSATPVGEYAGPNATVDGGAIPANASGFPTQRYPFTHGALDDATPNATGYSTAYWKGPFGFKEAFTHSPFDEFDALHRAANATTGDGVYLHDGEWVYLIAVTQDKQ